MKRLFIVAVLCLFSSPAWAEPLYSQGAKNSGTLYQSSWLDPDGSDYDQYVWDKFSVGSACTLQKIAWQGGYDPDKLGMGSKVLDFSIKIYDSIPAGTQPDIVAPPRWKYTVGGNASETLLGTYNGTKLYGYEFTLPTSCKPVPGTPYWLRIEAVQHGIPDWGLAQATSGDGSHFRQIHQAGDKHYQTVTGDAVFTLIGVPEPSSLVGLFGAAVAGLVWGWRRWRR
jgi:hypothetical protein